MADRSKITKAAQVADKRLREETKRVRKTVSLSLDADNYNWLLESVGRGEVSYTIDALIEAYRQTIEGRR